MPALETEPKSPAALALEEHLQSRIRATVHPDAGIIPGFIFTDPNIYQMELDRIFLKSWLFVAHTSEIPRPGDFVTREMAETSVVVSHGIDGQLRVFLNLCPHRGMRLTRSDCGHGRVFQCPYHGFTYDHQGQLIGVPEQQEAYGGHLDRQRLSLYQARVDVYQGLIFATWNPDAEPLREYLGPMAWYLDLVAGRAEMEILGTPQRWHVRGNWKTAAENFMDSYHVLYTHASIGRLGLPNPNYVRSGYQVDAGHGHGLGVGFPSPQPAFPPNIVAQFAQRLEPAQAELLRHLNNLHGTVFPNFSILISQSLNLDDRVISHTSLRQWQPRGPHEMVVYSWFLVEKDAPDEWKEWSRRLQSMSFSVSGMYEQDDAEMWTHVTQNLNTPVARRFRIDLNYEMGKEREPIQTFAGPGLVVPGKLQELTARQFYRRWRQLMLGEPDPAVAPKAPAPGHVSA